MKKGIKVILIIALYLLIGKIIVWDINQPVSIAQQYTSATNKIIFWEEVYVGEKPTSKDIIIISVLTREQRAFAVLFWPIIFVGPLLLILMFFVICFIKFIAISVWQYIIVPFFVTLWEIILFLLG
ncbi:MAG: hypothetical protein WC608_04035 [Parcubacteria group bacterium]